MCTGPLSACAILNQAASARVNQRAVIRRALRDHSAAITESDGTALGAAEVRLTDIARHAERARDADAMRGLEGEAAQVYFAFFDYLIRSQKEEFRFVGRSRRPPLDAVNAVLTFLNTAHRASIDQVTKMRRL